jgi:glycyl-tRNA synthetase beta chain
MGELSMTKTQSLANTSELLIEIGCEELPAKTLRKIETIFAEDFAKALNGVSLSFKSIRSFATPRRLALDISELRTQQATKIITKRGPAKTAAFDAQGNPTKAALGFAESCGTDMDSLTLQETEKGAWLVFQEESPGQTAEQLIPQILAETLNNLAIGKRMRWPAADFTWPDIKKTFDEIKMPWQYMGNGSFTRPIHWIVLLLDHKVIDAELFGVKTSNQTRGHRFHHPEWITLASAKEYESALLKGFVIADPNKRRDKILSDIHQLEKKHHFKTLNIDELLDEVTGLVEWPVVLMGEFEKSFLEIPKEALITAMQHHQKCFAIANSDNTLLPQFLIVSNIQSVNSASVIAGNEWVMKARLADAQFYYRVDKEITLQQRREGLKQVVFQAGLGSLWDKTERIAHLGKIIAKHIKANPKDTERAAILCKSDLLTQMVGEFPELQGIMGRYYALHDAEPETVALAIEQHYYPRFSQDILPESTIGCALTLADRIDSLVGIFGIGKRPTGDKDPFALRRQALSVLRILVAKKLDLDLEMLITVAKDQYQNTLPEKNATALLLDFCFERFRAWYQDQGIPARIFEAVLAKRPTNPFDFDRRIQAVNEFVQLKDAESLAAANKRVQNLLSKAQILLPNDAKIQHALLKEEAEIALEKALHQQEKTTTPLIEAGNYTEALKSLATLRENIDQFFTDVMVMVDDAALKQNRLILLNQLRILFLKIADISLL